MKKLSITLLILLVIQALLLVPGLEADVTQDGASDWRINTYPTDEGQYPHMVIGIVFVPGKWIVYENIYGSADTVQCSDIIVTKKAISIGKAYWILQNILKTVGNKDYTISMAVSICHPEWFVIYLNAYKINASKEVYDKVMEAISW